MKKRFLLFVAFFLFLADSSGAVLAGGPGNLRAKGGKAMEITSSAFVHEKMIPSKYTCDGKNISPPLAWSGAPTATKSFALICDDPDAPIGTWVHWVFFDIPATVTSLPENVSRLEEIPGLGKNGKNTSRHWGYDGPCPPSGIHRYYFKLYALDAMLNLQPGLTKEELLKAMQGHILAQAEIMGKYKR
jgi:Raf kinase inhibitor-like YbhB/YbcL family protein